MSQPTQSLWEEFGDFEPRDSEPIVSDADSDLDAAQAEWESDSPLPYSSSGFQGGFSTTPQSSGDLARLIYLITELPLKMPSVVAQSLPFAQDLQLLYKGLSITARYDDILPLYSAGAKGGPGTAEEAVSIILRMTESVVVGMRGPDRLRFHHELAKLRDSGSIFATAYEEVDVAGIDGTNTEIEKYLSGFTPWDTATGGGFYQGLIVVMAPPGVGKTSMLITMAEHLVRRDIPVWFFENEIPAVPMRGRVTPAVLREPKMRDPSMFRLFCGPYSAVEIAEMVEASPDSNRVVIFDNPDVMFGGSGGDSLRLDISAAYRHLIRVKSYCRSIFIPSQPQRVDEGKQLKMTNVAESWHKAWYADMIITLVTEPLWEGEHAIGVQVKTVKNRFGPKYKIGYFRYNYSDLTWEALDDPQMEWEFQHGKKAFDRSNQDNGDW